MTKSEYLSRLMNELKKNHVEDADEIVGEYEEHFAFKLSDGYTEEEIAAKLGDPAALASTFDAASAQRGNSSRITAVLGVGISDLFSAMFFALLFAWEAVMIVLSVACAALSVCLLTDLNIASLIPPMPYWCGAVFGIAIAALAIFAAIGCFYFAALTRQLMRSYGRFRRNTLAASSGKATLPSLAIYPQFSARTNRRIRSVALISLVVFAACTVLAMVVSMLSSGALEFWHVWGWFV